MITIFQRTEQVPAYALSYLINGDDSGISSEDQATIDKWYNDYASRLLPGEQLVISPSEDGEHFTWNPAFGLACDVVDCEILILK